MNSLVAAAGALLLAVVSSACAGGGVELTGPAAEGREAAERLACISCHSVDGSDKVGPTWRDLFGSEVELASGETVIADEAYLRSSISDPDEQIVEGFRAGVMSATIKPGSVSHADIEALIAYMKTLADES